MKIVVLAGGISSERDVSLKSGEMISRALIKNGHEVAFVDVFLGVDDEVGFFRDEKNINEQAISSKAPDIEQIKRNRPKSPDGYFGRNVLKLCKEADIVFLALHGQDGENGRLQATFDMMDIKYTGNGYLSCALAMDKSIAKQIFNKANINCPKGISLTKEQWENGEISDISIPVVVKPASEGSSMGVSIVEDEDKLNEAIEYAFKWENNILIEEYIKGREFSVATIRDMALPVIEIAPKSGFYNYENKYAPGQTVETCPAQLPENIANEMQNMAVSVTKALRLESYARMDFILENNTNNIYCLEANTLPGMTVTSLIPQEAKACGMNFEQLCERIIEVSLERYK